MRFRAERTQRHPGCDEALADFVDALDFIERHRRQLRAHGQQVAGAGRRRFRHLADQAGIDLERLVVVARRRILQQVDELRLIVVGLAGRTHLVEAADRRDRLLGGKRPGVQLAQLLLDTGQADTGNARGHTGEVFRHQRARQAQRFEFIAAAIRRNDRNAFLGQDLHQAELDGLLVVQEGFVLIEPRIAALGEAFL